MKVSSANKTLRSGSRLVSRDELGSSLLPWVSRGNKASSRYLAPIICFLCVFCVTLSQITCYKSSLPPDCKISLPVHSTARMLPVWGLPPNWSCTTGHCTLYACTQRLYSTVHTGAERIQVWSKSMIYNWELFRYITRASTNVLIVKAFSKPNIFRE